MALPDLTDQFVAQSFKGLLHTSNVPLVEGTAPQKVYDGQGNESAMKLGSVDQGVKFSGSVVADNFKIMINAVEKTLIDYIYPVGSVYFSIDPGDPSSKFIGTTWERISEGQFIVGQGTFSGKSFEIAGNGGQYSITVDNNHYHGVGRFSGTGNDDGFFITSGTNDTASPNPPIWSSATTFTTRRVPGDADAAVFNNTNTGNIAPGTTPGTSIVTTGPLSLTNGTDSTTSVTYDITPNSYGLYVWKRTS